MGVLLSKIIISCLVGLLFVLIPGFSIRKEYKARPKLTALAVLTGLIFSFFSVLSIYDYFYVKGDESSEKNGVSSNTQEKNAQVNPATITEAEYKRGKSLALVCAACHGDYGVAVIPEYPNLAGLDPNYFIKQMNEYRSGEIPNAIMMGMSAGLNDSDIESLANYYAALPKFARENSESN